MTVVADQKVLITGGGTGIGKATALAFAACGSTVMISGRRETVLQQAAAESTGATILTHSADVADRDAVNRMIESATEQLGQIDILVNAAGVNIKNRSMAEMTPAQWDQIMSINATGAYNTIYATLPQMRKRKDGQIINVSSVSGKRAYGMAGVAYCASKFAMTGLGTALSQEEAQHGIRVTNVYPGEVDTPILEQRPTPVSDEHRGRILQPQDVADMILAIAQLPPRATVPEIIVKPTTQDYV